MERSDKNGLGAPGMVPFWGSKTTAQLTAVEGTGTCSTSAGDKGSTGPSASGDVRKPKTVGMRLVMEA